MKVKLNLSIEYDSEQKDLWEEYVESMADYPTNLGSFVSFCIDRFASRDFRTFDSGASGSYTVLDRSGIELSSGGF